MIESPLKTKLMDVSLYMGETRPSKKEWKFLRKWINELYQSEEFPAQIFVRGEMHDITVSYKEKSFNNTKSWWFITAQDHPYNAFGKSLKKVTKRFQEGFAIYLRELQKKEQHNEHNR